MLKNRKKLLRLAVYGVGIILLILLVLLISRCSAESKMKPAGGESYASFSNAPSYSIEFDTSVYKSEHSGNSELISMISDPLNYMMITYESAVEYSERFEELMNENAVNITDTELSLQNIESKGIRYSTGSSDEDIVTTVYVINANNMGCFILRYINPVSSPSVGQDFQKIAETFRLS